MHKYTRYLLETPTHNATVYQLWYRLCMAGQDNLYRLNTSLWEREDLRHNANLWHQVHTKGINLAKCYQ